MRRTEVLGARAGIRRLFAHRLQQRRQIERRRFLDFRFVPRERQRRLDHPLHIVEVGDRLPLLLLVLDQLGAQSEPGQRRPQVVRNRRQHLGAVADELLQALLHAVEGERRPLDLERAVHPQRRRVRRRGRAARPLRRTSTAARWRDGPPRRK